MCVEKSNLILVTSISKNITRWIKPNPIISIRWQKYKLKIKNGMRFINYGINNEIPLGHFTYSKLLIFHFHYYVVMYFYFIIFIYAFMQYALIYILLNKLMKFITRKYDFRRINLIFAYCRWVHATNVQ